MRRAPINPPAGLPASISSEEIAALPTRQYEGPVHLVATRDDLEAALEDMRQERVAGFDTETRPAFVRGQSYAPALAQVATSRAVYLFQLQDQPHERALHDALAAWLAAPRLTKAGIALADDLRKLRGLFAFEDAGVVDLGALARRSGFAQSGARNLAALLLGWRIPKGAQTTNWAARRLTSRQIAYAATDAWVCRELHLRFEALGIQAPATDGGA